MSAPDPASADRRSAVRQRILVVINTASRGDTRVIVERLQRQAPSDIDLDLRRTVGPGTATDLAREGLAGAAVVVAVGGDGTVADVATALYGSGVPLAVIPAGSTNIVARELRIPTKTDAAIALLFGDHAERPIDLGICGDRCFLHMAGAGFDSQLFADTDLALKRRLGWLAYLPPAARNLGRPARRFRIVTDGTTTEVTSPLVLVANGRSVITTALPLYPAIRSDDGWLDVLVFTPSGPWRIARTLGRLATRSLGNSPYVIHLRARHVELAADPPLPVQLDGDVVSETPAGFSIAPAALRVIVPVGTGRRGGAKNGGAKQP